MVKRRVKKRTHVGHLNPGSKPAAKAGNRPPKSMVIRVGASEVGQSVSQLVRDVRTMMEPDTATRLKERRSNKLRDYTTMAGPLGVTHLMLFSRSETTGNVNLRLALTPRGPTFHFRVEKYSLCKDIRQHMKRPKSGVAGEHTTAPLLVMNNFTTAATPATEDANGAGENKAAAPAQIPKHLESLATSVFQSLFPPINPTATPLKGIRRVLLADRVSSSSSSSPDDDGAAKYILNLRHYSIETRTAKSVPKALRRLDAAEKLTHAGQKRKRSAIPNLGKLADVADYLLDPHAADGFTSGSESEPDTDAEVEMVNARARKVQRRKAERDAVSGASKDASKANVERKAIKLHELGPRLRLRLTKVEEGVCGGKVMWHEYIHKSKEEVRAMEKVHEQRRQEKERRRAEQKANVERKKAERKARGEPEDDEDEDAEMLEDGSDDEWDDEMEDALEAHEEEAHEEEADEEDE